MNRRWSIRTDFMVIRLPLALLALYLVFVQLLKKPFIASGQIYDGVPSLRCDIYLWMQFIVFIFVATIASFYFEEAFRPPAAQYIQTLRPGVMRAVLLRWLRLVILMEALYLPFIGLSLVKINRSLQDGNQGFDYQPVSLSVMLFQCAVAMLFYVTITMFLTALFKSRVYALVLLMAYCALEATVMPVIMARYAIFRGAFSSADFYSYFMPNTAIMLTLSVLLLPLTLIMYKTQKSGGSIKKLLSTVSR